MPVVEKSLEELLEEIEFEESARYDYIVPQEVPRRVLFTFISYLQELSSFLYRYKVEIENGTGYGDGHCPLFLALDNAFYRGNLEVEIYPITVKVFTGRMGLVIRIRDCGGGFDFKAVQEDFLQKKRYYQGSGAGFRAYNNNVASVSFEGNGSVINLMYKFGGLKLREQIDETYRQKHPL